MTSTAQALQSAIGIFGQFAYHVTKDGSQRSLFISNHKELKRLLEARQLDLLAGLAADCHKLTRLVQFPRHATTAIACKQAAMCALRGIAATTCTCEVCTSGGGACLLLLGHEPTKPAQPEPRPLTPGKERNVRFLARVHCSDGSSQELSAQSGCGQTPRGPTEGPSDGTARVQQLADDVARCERQLKLIHVGPLEYRARLEEYQSAVLRLHCAYPTLPR